MFDSHPEGKLIILSGGCEGNGWGRERGHGGGSGMERGLGERMEICKCEHLYDKPQTWKRGGSWELMGMNLAGTPNVEDM